MLALNRFVAFGDTNGDYVHSTLQPFELRYRERFRRDNNGLYYKSMSVMGHLVEFASRFEIVKYLLSTVESRTITIANITHNRGKGFITS